MEFSLDVLLKRGRTFAGEGILYSRIEQRYKTAGCRVYHFSQPRSDALYIHKLCVAVTVSWRQVWNRS